MGSAGARVGDRTCLGHAGGRAAGDAWLRLLSQQDDGDDQLSLQVGRRPVAGLPAPAELRELDLLEVRQRAEELAQPHLPARRRHDQGQRLDDLCDHARSDNRCALQCRGPGRPLRHLLSTQYQQHFHSSDASELSRSGHSPPGKRVALTYVLQNVMSPDCQGDPACRKTRTVAVISAARPAARP